MPSVIGLRHPASASCLGRHLRLTGRCPNNSSLFPPLAAVVVVALWAYSAEELFLISRLSRSAERSKRYFHGWGRKGKQLLHTLASSPSPSRLAPCHLSQRERLWRNRKLYRYAKGSPFGGAGAQRLRGRGCLRRTNHPKASSFSVYHDFCLWKIVYSYVMIGINEYSRKLTARKVTDHA